MLGVDLGLSRTGLAVSDELRLTVRALADRTPKSRAEDVAFLVEQVRELDVTDVLIGVPSSGVIRTRAPGFADALRAALVVPPGDAAVRVHLVDEDDTSKEATARLVESGTRKSARKAALDSEAARGLVLRFLGIA